MDFFFFIGTSNIKNKSHMFNYYRSSFQSSQFNTIKRNINTKAYFKLQYDSLFPKTFWVAFLSLIMCCGKYITKLYFPNYIFQIISSKLYCIQVLRRFCRIKCNSTTIALISFLLDILWSKQFQFKVSKSSILEFWDSHSNSHCKCHSSFSLPLVFLGEE